MAANAVCPAFYLSEAHGIWWVLAIWRFYLKSIDPERTATATVKDAAVPLLHKVRISSIHVFYGHLTVLVLWSNPVNYGEMQSWDSGSQKFTTASPWGRLLDMTKFYWNREKMLKSEGKLAYPVASLPCYVFSTCWIYGLLFFLQTFVSWKNCGFRTISSRPCSLEDNHNTAWTLCCPIACILLVIIITTILFSSFCIFLQVRNWFNPKLYGEKTRRTAASC